MLKTQKPKAGATVQAGTGHVRCAFGRWATSHLQERESEAEGRRFLFGRQFGDGVRMEKVEEGEKEKVPRAFWENSFGGISEKSKTTPGFQRDIRY